MADGVKDGLSGSIDETIIDEAPTQPTVEVRSPSRPYEAPHLRYLGSVRDLTSAGASGILDGAGQSQNEN